MCSLPIPQLFEYSFLGRSLHIQRLSKLWSIFVLNRILSLGSINFMRIDTIRIDLIFQVSPLLKHSTSMVVMLNILVVPIGTFALRYISGNGGIFTIIRPDFGS